MFSLCVLYTVPRCFAIIIGPFFKKYFPTSRIILYFSFKCSFVLNVIFHSKSTIFFCKYPACTIRFRLLFLEGNFPHLLYHCFDSLGKIT
jgi:hypothetical protein